MVVHGVLNPALLLFVFLLRIFRVFQFAFKKDGHSDVGPKSESDSNDSIVSSAGNLYVIIPSTSGATTEAQLLQPIQRL